MRLVRLVVRLLVAAAAACSSPPPSTLPGGWPAPSPTSPPNPGPCEDFAPPLLAPSAASRHLMTPQVDAETSLTSTSHTRLHEV